MDLQQPPQQQQQIDERRPATKNNNGFQRRVRRNLTTYLNSVGRATQLQKAKLNASASPSAATTTTTTSTTTPPPSLLPAAANAFANTAGAVTEATDAAAANNHNHKNGLAESPARNSQRKRAFATGTGGVGYRLGRRTKLIIWRTRLSDAALSVAVFGILLMIVEAEISATTVNFGKKSLFSDICKVAISCSTLLLEILIVAYHVVEIKLFLVNNAADDWRVAGNARRWSQLALELFICAIHPVPRVNVFFSWTTWSYLHSSAADDTVGRTYNVPLDVLLSLPMFLRLYLIGRVILLHSRLYTDASSRSISALNRVNVHTRFILKTYMTVMPGTLLLMFVFSFWIIAAWTMRACERYDNPELEQVLNALWLIPITFLSIGYGDVVPSTYCGRAVSIITGCMGSGCMAIAVAVIARKLELNSAEKHVQTFMMDTEVNKQLRNAAANVLRETWLVYKYSKLTHHMNAMRVRTHQRKFLLAIYALRRAKMDHRKLIDNASSLSDIDKSQTQIHDMVVEQSERLDKLDQHYGELHKHLEVLSQSVAQLNSSVTTLTTALLDERKERCLKNAAEDKSLNRNDQCG